MQLIVAEKPSVARDLARVLGVPPHGEHAFEGDRYVITWCIGHLVELDEPAAYDPAWKAWRLDRLPMLPEVFQLRPAKHAVAQLRAVTKLLRDRRFASVVNACDAGREGELIFRYVHQFAHGGPSARGGPPVLRLWISSLTDDAIRRGFAALRPGAQLDPLADAARSRSEADWLVGMNATRAVTARGRDVGHTALYSIGRVQTPTLAMLVGRECAIRAFVPRDYWEVRGDFRTANGERFAAGWRHGKVARLASAAIADAIVTRDRAHAAAADPAGPRVERVRAKTTKEPPPLLFDLTSLQRTANRRFGFSAARTLEIAQALYERHKVLTYPRTDARHLSSDVVPELPAIFGELARLPAYAAFAAPLLASPPRIGRRIVDDTKVHDHHAIIPTTHPVRDGALDRDEQRLFDLVVRRFLGAFHPDAEFAVTEVWIRVGAASGAPDLPAAEPEPPRAPAAPPGATSEPPILEALPPDPDRYLARGRVRLVAGWQAVAGIDGGARRDADGAEPTAVLPLLVEGQPLDGAFRSLAKQTTPPPRYTEATLLGAMEGAGAAIDDEALRLAMRDTGLGTPATRAAIIETLIRRDYIAREHQHLVPTALGEALIDALPVASLASPELTGRWEARLARIARGEDSRAAFMADIARYVADTVDAIRGAAPPAAPAAVPIGACPACGAGVIEALRDFRCSTGCGFAMHKRVAGRAISADLAAVLLARRKSTVLRGFRSKAGKPFAAALVLEPDGALRFDFADAHRSPRPSSDARPAGDDAPSRSPRARRGKPSAATRGRGSREGIAPAAGSREGIDRSHAGAPRDGIDRSHAGASRDRIDTRAAAGAPERTRRAAGSRAAKLPGAAALSCPRCRQGTLIAGQRGWGCTRWRDGCRFVIWFQTGGRRLTAAQLRDLVIRGKTRKARFVSERGVELAARLVLDAAVDGGARLEPA